MKATFYINIYFKQDKKMENTENREVNYLRLFITIVILMALFFYMIAPSFLAVRPASNENAALGKVKSFVTSAAIYAANNDEQVYFKNGATDFGDFFAHVSPKGGYVFTYFASPDRKKFLYFAIPVSQGNGEHAFLGNKRHQLFKAPVDQEVIDRFVLPGESSVTTEIDWTKEGGQPIKGIEFVEISIFNHPKQKHIPGAAGALPSREHKPSNGFR